MADPHPVLEVRDLETTFAVRSPLLRRQIGEVHAVSGVSFTIGAGEALGLVGESGCGKSTVARTLVGLERPRRGQILLDGVDLALDDAAALRRTRQQVQLIFQDPYAALNPRMTIRDLIEEGWKVNPGLLPREKWNAETEALLERVGLDASLADRRPRQLSGGQRQRVCIARALAVRPRLIICDEAVSALDVSIRSQILNLLRRLQRDSGVAFLFISHDLGVVRYLCQRVAVMYLGHVVEMGMRDRLYDAPQHPYTQALLSAAPTLRPWEADRASIMLKGDVPSPLSPPSGCRFRTRCWRAQERCAAERPLLREVDGRTVACHFPGTETSDAGGATVSTRPAQLRER